MVHQRQQREVQSALAGIQCHQQRQAHEPHVAEDKGPAEHTAPFGIQPHEFGNQRAHADEQHVHDDVKQHDNAGLRQICPRGTGHGVGEHDERDADFQDERADAVHGLLPQHMRLHADYAHEHHHGHANKLQEHRVKLRQDASMAQNAHAPCRTRSTFQAHKRYRETTKKPSNLSGFS